MISNCFLKFMKCQYSNTVISKIQVFSGNFLTAKLYSNYATGY